MVPMFYSFRSNRLEQERTYWVRDQKNGKALWIVRSTSSFAILLVLLARWLGHVYPLSQGERLAGVVCSVVVAWLMSELWWRRGVRLTRR